MVTFKSAAILAALLAFGDASPLQELGPLSLFEKLTAPASGWVAHGPAPAEAVLNMHIGLKQKDIKGLEKKLLDISSPSSPNYGKWLSKEEVEQYTAPSATTTSLVKLWLAAYGITGDAVRQPSPDWISFDVPVRKAESLLQTRYSLFHGEDDDQVTARALEYSVPRLLHDHIDTIQPTTVFHADFGPKEGAVAPAPVSARAAGSACPDGVTAECISDYYNVDYAGRGTQSLAVTGFLDFSASHDDAAAFLQRYFPRGRGSDFADVTVGDDDDANPNNERNATLEGNLDTQIALSVGYPSPVTYLMVGPNNQDQPSRYFGDQLVSFGQWLNAASDPPAVVSSSYLGSEPDFPGSYKDRICGEFAKAGARGITVLFCSGDFGVSGLNHQSSCPDGYVPTFPASCPYVTAVGSTQFGGDQREVAAVFPQDGATGGGFSEYWAAPDYQKQDTAAYVGRLPASYRGKFAEGGRGIPDVAMVGVNWDIVVGNRSLLAYGTSASTPAWASLLSLVNDHRRTLGKGTLGFVNPALYGNTEVRAALRDAVGGSSKGCGETGFPATEGWDAATGLGSLDFGALRQALARL
ncbi:family S53 protease-like protein [Cordyceps javanica]|uniref:Family S53 protease-like protein n=1 Tax=Cordyceps javanica TaxID=43265 RepID=A0A545UTQ3_9HYPO|nr:family S53 protease-like protein [Cordyceps javanica]TQW02136.1 family S53 protease-like protein [Cordyceps javanica]